MKRKTGITVEIRKERERGAKNLTLGCRRDGRESESSEDKQKREKERREQGKRVRKKV